MSNHLLFQIVVSVVLDHGLGTVNFALHKSAVQSSTSYWIFNWTADKAVDGNSDGSDPDTSRTCSATLESPPMMNHTWEVDIGFQIIVKTITVYGRTDKYFDQLSGFKLYIGNVSKPWIYNQEIPINSSNTTNYVFKPNDAIASVISLMKLGTIIVICEVTVEGECLGGNFSEFCNLTCGTCYAYQPCNKENGTCPLGCDQGWKGTFCKEGCGSGNFGYNCNETCGHCLYGKNSCSARDGNCTNGCKAGWQGYQCNRGCERGNYGYNCNETCGHCLYGNNSCSISDGNCTNGCIAGWQGYHCNRGTLGPEPTADGPNAGVIVGSVLAAVGVSIFVMVIIIVIVKYRRKKNNNETTTDNVTPAAHYVNLVVGNSDAACKITARSITEKVTTFSAIEEPSLKRGMPIGATNRNSGVMEPDVPVQNVYEKLRDVTETTESAYCTIEHNLINDQKMESMETCNTFVETLQSLESAMKNVEGEISVLLDKKEKLLSKELETARADKLQDKRQKKDSDKDKDSTIVKFVQALQSIEGELRILEDKRKCLLGRKEILLRQELAKTTENEK